MKLLVTRPQPDAQVLADRLEAAGHSAIVFPVLAIQPLLFDPGPLRRASALLVTSANALRAVKSCAEINRDVPVYAVGGATAALARELGFSEVVEAGGTVDDLAAALTAQRAPNHGPLLHLCGVHTVGGLVDRLRARGFTVEAVTVYEAQPAGHLSDAVQTALRSGLDGVTLLSPRTATIFAGLITAAHVTGTVKRLTAFCLSAAVAEAAGRLPWGRIRTAAEPTVDGLLSVINAPT